MTSSPETDPAWIVIKRANDEYQSWRATLTPEQRNDYDVKRFVSMSRNKVADRGVIYLNPVRYDENRAFSGLLEAFDSVEVIYDSKYGASWKVSGPRPDPAKKWTL